MNIYVANLSFDLQDEDLKELFVPYGEVSSARIIMDKMTDRSRGFGFVEMADDVAGGKAITALSGATIGGRSIKVNEAKPKQEEKVGGRGEWNYNNPKSYNQNIY
jgi:RNA recognition motif-containing protein